MRTDTCFRTGSMVSRGHLQSFNPAARKDSSTVHTVLTSSRFQLISLRPPPIPPICPPPPPPWNPPPPPWNPPPPPWNPPPPPWNPPPCPNAGPVCANPCTPLLN